MLPQELNTFAVVGFDPDVDGHSNPLVVEYKASPVISLHAQHKSVSRILGTGSE